MVEKGKLRKLALSTMHGGPNGSRRAVHYNRHGQVAPHLSKSGPMAGHCIELTTVASIRKMGPL